MRERYNSLEDVTVPLVLFLPLLSFLSSLCTSLFAYIVPKILHLIFSDLASASAAASAAKLAMDVHG